MLRGQLVTSAWVRSLHDQTRPVVVQAGVSGYMLNDDTFPVRTRAIRTVAAGQTSFSPGLSLPSTD